MKGLLLVDLQNDFLPGGALPVPKGDEIIPLIQEIVSWPFDLIVATKDWHPENHGCFAQNHSGKRPGDHILLGGVDQILWPTHCVQGTWGSEFAPGWDSANIDKTIYKGSDPGIDSYSAFYDNAERRSTGLHDYLQSKCVKELYIAGLATDYCVKYSVLDAIRLGFIPYVIVDACRGINLNPGDSHRAFLSMEMAGAVLIPFEDAKSILESQSKGL